MAPAQQNLTEKKKVFSKNHHQITLSITSQEPAHTAQYSKECYGLLTKDMFMDNQQQIINATIPFRGM